MSSSMEQRRKVVTEATRTKPRQIPLKPPALSGSRQCHKHHHDLDLASQINGNLASVQEGYLWRMSGPRVARILLTSMHATHEKLEKDRRYMNRIAGVCRRRVTQRLVNPAFNKLAHHLHCQNE